MEIGNIITNLIDKKANPAQIIKVFRSFKGIGLKNKLLPVLRNHVKNIEFPEKFKAANTAKKVQVVAGGTRTSPSGKQKVTLTKSEVETANKLGVSLQEYARHKIRRDESAR